MSRIQALPTDGLSYSPTDEKYWDPKGLQQEIERVFDICHGCRLCFNLCPSFPALFDAVDQYDGDVLQLKDGEIRLVEDLCFQCKLCYVKCPYTADDGHEFNLDFPRLMLRASAQRAKKEGIKLREKMLSNPDRLGKLASLTPKLANWANSSKIHRIIMQKMLGIHQNKNLPDFHGETFERWLKKNKGLPSGSGKGGKVAFFYTCFVNYNNPEVGKDSMAVLAKNDCQVACPKQNCCGMPALEAGDVQLAQKMAQSNVDTFLPLVREGYTIVAPGPTCSYMLRKEYAELLGTPEAKELQEAVKDISEYLFELKREKKFNREFASSPGQVAYHLPCHLQAQNIGFRSRDMMKIIPGAKVSTVEKCTCHDGTWAMKTEYFDLSMQYGKPAFEAMKDVGADTLTTDCPLAAIQFEQGMGTRPIHPIQVLARAYEKDGFSQVVEAPAPKPAANPGSTEGEV